MIALLLTVDYPPNKGGVSRYYEGLIEVSQTRIGVAGIDLGKKPPDGNTFKIRLQQIFWAKNILQQTPKKISILVGQPHLGLGAILARRSFGLFIHGGEWGDYPFGTKLVRLILFKAKILIVNSNATARMYIPNFLKRKVIVLKPGLTNSFIRTSLEVKNSNRIRSANCLHILSVTRLSPRKGLIKLIRAVEMLIADRYEVSMIIIGDGSEYNNLNKEIKTHSKIKILRNITDDKLIRYYKTADLFALLPMRISGGEAWEGFGIVFLEASAWGLPIITSTAGGIKEATTPSGTIYLHEKCSEWDICKQIQKLINDETILTKLGQANKKWAITQSWENRLSLIDKILDRLSEVKYK